LKEQVFSLQDATKVTSLLTASYKKAVQIKQEFLQQQSSWAKVATVCCPNLTSAVVDIREWKGISLSLKQAIELAKGLANEHNMI
jgi:hypothetical protein